MFFEINEGYWVRYEDIRAYHVEKFPSLGKSLVHVFLPEGHPFEKMTIEPKTSKKLQELLHYLANGPEKIRDNASY